MFPGQKSAVQDSNKRNTSEQYHILPFRFVSLFAPDLMVVIKQLGGKKTRTFVETVTERDRNQRAKFPDLFF